MNRPTSLARGLPLGFGLLLLALASAAGCSEEGKTTPGDCPQLPIYDIQGGDKSFDDPEDCVTNVGHAVSSVGNSGGTTSAGGKTSSAGKSQSNMAGAGGS